MKNNTTTESQPPTNNPQRQESKRGKRLIVLSVTTSILTTFLAVFFAYRFYSQQFSIVKDSVSNKQYVPSSLSQNNVVDLGKGQALSYNTNSMVNPVTVSGLLNWVRASYVFSEPDTNKLETRQFVSRDGRYTFEYPDFMDVYEFPKGYSSNTHVLITNNKDDYKNIEQLAKCIETRQPQSETICELNIGDYFVMSLSGPVDKPFSTNNSTTPKVEINSGRFASLSGVDALIDEPIKLSSKAESRVELGVSNRPIFRYLISLNEKVYQDGVFVTFSSYSYPAAYPYKQTLATILATLKVN